MTDTLEEFQQTFEKNDVQSRMLPPLKATRIKIITMGDAGVGKSSLVRRFWKDKARFSDLFADNYVQFSTKYVSTIGVDYGVLDANLNGRDIKVNFWDFSGVRFMCSFLTVSGHTEFLEVRNEFYQDTQGALLVFDVSSRRSFEALDSWMREAKKFGASPDMSVVVIANKMDLPKEKHVVPIDVIEQWAAASGFELVETSAMNGEGVGKAFESLFIDTLKTVTRLEEIHRLSQEQ